MVYDVVYLLAFPIVRYVINFQEFGNFINLKPTLNNS